MSLVSVSGETDKDGEGPERGCVKDTNRPTGSLCT